MMSIECPKGTEFGPFIRRFAERVVVYHSGERWMSDWMAAICCLESGWGGSVKGPLGYNVIGYHWIPGMDWSKEWIEAIEGATGKARRYRRFAGFEECLEALYYLIEDSELYLGARELYRMAVEEARPDALEEFIRNFSAIYCPKDKKHGVKVSRIFKELTKAADNKSACLSEE